MNITSSHLVSSRPLSAPSIILISSDPISPSAPLPMKIERHNHIMNTHTSSSSSSSPLTSATTFVQADINTFRDLVQKLTGLASDTQRLPVRKPLSSSKPSRNPVDFTAPRRSPFKLQERRHTLRKLEIELGLISLSNSSSSSSTRQTHRLDSPVTPLCSDFLFFPSPGTESPSSPAVSEEEKAIAEKGFYFHPSPLNTPRGSEPPELLALFPLNSSSQSNQD